MKTVGILLREWDLPNNSTGLYGIKRDLLRKLNNYEINVIGIPVDFQNSTLNKLIPVLDMCDGVVLSGGKDDFPIDKDIVRYLYDKDIPTLGICLGMQDMSATFNGEVLTLDNNNHSSDNEYVHDVILDKTSKLYEIIQEERIKVNSRHHDYVKNTDLDIIAYSDDNVIEAVEDKEKRFFIGVQWHPESLNDIYSERLFDEFVNSLY